MASLKVRKASRSFSAFPSACDSAQICMTRYERLTAATSRTVLVQLPFPSSSSASPYSPRSSISPSRSSSRSLNMANASPGSWSRANARTVPPAVSAPPLALLHRRLAIHPDPTRGLVVRPYDASFRGLWEGQAVRIPYGSTKPEETRWKEEQDVPGIEVDCVAGLLVGFQGALRSLLARDVAS